MENRLPRIGFVIDDLGYGGAQRQLSIVCRGLTGLAEPRVYCMSEVIKPFGEKLANSGTQITTFRRRGNVDMTRLNELTRRLSSDGIDIVHGILDASNTYAYIAARRTGLPCVLSLRAQELFFTGIKKWFLGYMFRRADRVVANSRAGVQYLSDCIKVRPDRLVLVPNAIGPPPDTDTTGIERSLLKRRIIGIVGRLVELKRVDMLIDAFAILAERLPDTTLLIVGDGPERPTLEKQAQRLGIADRTRFAGHSNNVETMMSDLACLALPSESEGFPNVAMEALAGGVPVVASPAGDVADIVSDGLTG
ncbi:MAG: glycosyltransferase, partial [Candidatus Krumholzibacteria bacterium]|nr:glycosyltransferase [Candidatus Krumholzibacteria bacterium]